MSAAGDPLEAATLIYAASVELRETAAAELARAILDASHEGMSEVEIARRTGLSRTTVRAWKRAA